MVSFECHILREITLLEWLETEGLPPAFFFLHEMPASELEAPYRDKLLDDSPYGCLVHFVENVKRLSDNYYSIGGRGVSRDFIVMYIED